MTTTFKQFKSNTLKNPAVKAEYVALGPEFDEVKSIIEERIEDGDVV